MQLIIYYYNKKKQQHDTEYIIRYCNIVNVFTIICINLKCLVEKVIFFLSQLFECCYIMISTKIKQQKSKAKILRRNVSYIHKPIKLVFHNIADLLYFHQICPPPPPPSQACPASSTGRMMISPCALASTTLATSY